MHLSPKEPIQIIALDGAAATGKSTTASALALKLGYLHVDTGSHFRILCHHLIAHNYKPTDDTRSIESLLEDFSVETEIIQGKAVLKIQNQLLEKEALRSEAINQSVSQFASLAPIRTFLLEYQQSLKPFAQSQGYAGMVVEGRDIGSVVFPSADLKVFLYADEQTRIRRRQEEGQIDPIAQRDDLDSSRKLAPLTCPDGALELNTSLLSLEAVVDSIIQTIESA